MNTKAKHTPGPYRYDDTWGIIYGANDTEVAACHSNKADAAFIVRACNAHDDLIAALSNAVRCAERDGMQGNPGSAPAWVRKARDTLAKATATE